MKPQDFVNKYYKYAKAIEIDSGAPVAFLLAQAAIESGWAKYKIGNNLFGITANSSWTGKKKLCTTYEVHNTNKVKYAYLISKTQRSDGKWLYKVKRWFRNYDTPEGCFADHLEVLRKPWFKEAWNHTDDAYKFAECIARGDGKYKYATAPNYEQSLKEMVRTIERLIGRMPTAQNVIVLAADKIRNLFT
jgi:flagellar protein FlgJ